jgi:perosamine synthetase
VSSGTAALEVGLELLGVRRGDEVIVPALTYAATVSPIIRRGAVPVCADVEDLYGTLSSDSVEALLTSKTRCIVTMDYGGQPCEHVRISTLARSAGVPILHDGAQSMGGELMNRSLLSYGSVCATSFHAAKVVTCVEGGMILLSSARMARRARILREQGEQPGHKYVHTEVGSNYRLSDLHAAIGIAQMDRCQSLISRRRTIAEAYRRRLSDSPSIRCPSARPGARHGYFFFALRIPRRDKVAARLLEHGVETRVVYPRPVYDQPAFRHFVKVPLRCAAAEKICAEVLALPMWPGLTSRDIDIVVDELKSALRYAL